MTRVSVVQIKEREAGVRGAIAALGQNPVKNKEVLIKPNFNTADPTPGSTHNDTLAALVDQLWEMGAASISLGERSYTPTRQVMETNGVAMLKQLGSNRVIMESGIFELRQLKRAAELGIGVRSASEIDLIPADDASVGLAAALKDILALEQQAH